MSHSVPSKFWYSPASDRVVACGEHASSVLEIGASEMGLDASEVHEMLDHIGSFEDEDDRADALDAMESDALELAFASGWVRGGRGAEVFLHHDDPKTVRRAVRYFHEMFGVDRIALTTAGWDGILEAHEVARFIKSGRLNFIENVDVVPAPQVGMKP